MLVSSILKYVTPPGHVRVQILTSSLSRVFYWLTARFEISLLIQAVIMILMQILLLNYSLKYRNSSTSSSGAQRDLNKPFATSQDSGSREGRPFHFWQWRSARPYWMFMAYYTITLVILQLLLGWSPWFSALQGYFALGIEATLPLPQVLANERAQSVKGFRLSVLVNWLLGDVMKMTYFFMALSPIPWAFKLCGLLQSVCDTYLGVQYWRFGPGRSGSPVQDGVTRGSGALEPGDKWKSSKDPRFQ